MKQLKSASITTGAHPLGYGKLPLYRVYKGRLVAVESCLQEMTDEYDLQIDVICHIFRKVSRRTQNTRQ